MTNHAKGPWVVCKAKQEHLSIRAEGYGVICDIPGYGVGSRIANANLIAAAPDLLFDLCEAAETLRKYERLHRAKNTEESTAKAEVNAALAGRLEKTIAKARGES
jgi:hypothetical protein